jgi:hypothetical protein
MGVMKIQLTFQQKTWVPHSRFFLPFFIVNDNSKLDLICVISHSVSQTNNFGSTTKKRKNCITYNQ